MSQPRLPLELLYYIIRSWDLSKAGLCNLSGSSNIVRDEAQRALFRNVGPLIVGAYNDEDTMLERRPAELFFEAIISSPHHLAFMVINYSQITSWTADFANKGDSTLHRHNQEKMFDTMSLAFKLMKNLKKFSSYAYNDSDGDQFSPRPMIDSLCQSHFTLDSFSWGHAHDELKVLEEFLPQQIKLRSLRLLDGIDHITNESNIERIIAAGQKVTQSCTRLELLAAPIFTTEVILRGNPNIKFLRWEATMRFFKSVPDPENHWQHIYRTLQGVKYLEYASGYTGLSIEGIAPYSIGLSLKDIAPYLTGLGFLTMPNTSVDTVSDITNTLPSLRAIHFYHSTPPQTSTSAVTDWQYDEQSVSDIFLHHNNLRYVDVERYTFLDADQSNQGSNSPPLATAYDREFKRFTRATESADLRAALPATEHLQLGRDVDKEWWWEKREELVDSLNRLPH